MPSELGAVVPTNQAALSAILQATRRALQIAQLPVRLPIIVGFSGGPDSLALLWSLHYLAGEGLAPQPVPVHVDHQLQEHSGDMAQQATQLGAQLGLTVLVRRVDVPLWPEYHHGGVEAGARAARYAALAAVAREYGTDWIAVGHTRDDQAETVLLRLIRGAGLEGLAAMRLVTELEVALDPTHRAFAKVQVFRPLLKVRRSLIEEALRHLDLEPVRDPTNVLPSYERNAIRHSVLPLLEKIRPGATEQIAHVAEQLQEDASVLNTLAQEAFLRVSAMIDGVVSLRRAEFCALSPALQNRVLQRAIAKYLPALPRERRLALRTAVQAGRVGRRIELGKGVIALINYNEVLIGPANRVEETLRLHFGQPLLRPGSVIPLTSSEVIPLENGWYLHVVQAPKHGWVLRTRRAGDRLQQTTSQYPVRLQDWLVNRKIPSYLRDWLPLVANNGVVWWIVGLEGTSYRSPDGELSLRLEKQGGTTREHNSTSGNGGPGTSTDR